MTVASPSEGSSLDNGPPDAPRAGFVERIFRTLGVPDHVARLVVAADTVRGSWLAAALAVVAMGAATAHGRRVDQGLLGFIVPLLPVGGVATAFGPAADPIHELALATPTSAFKLLMIRTTVVLAASLALTASAAAAVPGIGWSTVGWLLPSVALVAVTLVLCTVMDPLWAAGTAAALWIGGLVALRVVAPAAAAPFHGPAQGVFLAVVATAVPVVARRRDRLELADRGARLFRQYVSPGVAEVLVRDPWRVELGGAVVEISVLFADLPGFTALSERAPPQDVVAMLNRIFGEAVPLILEQGGTLDKFVGDALMAIWGAPNKQPDHAVRGARAALAMQAAVNRVAEGNPELPCFRIGLNSGPALVGNIGSDQIRNFTAIGDTVNLAARLQEAARPGEVVIGPGTWEAIRNRAVLRPLGPVQVRGHEAPVEAFVLEGLAEPSLSSSRASAEIEPR